MAGEGDAKARFPRQEVADGQVHGYLGDVEVYDPAPAGSSNTAADRASGKGVKAGKSGSVSIVGDDDTAADTEA